MDQICSLNKTIGELEKATGRQGSKLEGHQSLTSITGIGKMTGEILLSVIGDVHEFPDESQLASESGIVQRVSNSNQTEQSGRNHNRGSKLGPAAPVHSALTATNHSPNQ